MKFNGTLIITVFLVLIFNACKNKPNKFSKHPHGYHYQLLAFSNEANKNNIGYIVVLNAAYLTQKDSVFWSSTNDFDNKYYIQITPNYNQKCIESFVQNSNEGDSACLLIPKQQFFKQQFFTEKIPSFCKTDSVVKVNLKISAIYKTSKIDSLLFEWAKTENTLIKNYLTKNNIQNYYRDSLNVYWITGNHDPLNINKLKNKTISLSYKGYFLNGKQFDESPQNWQVNPSTPDQMLKGLNYVIKYLNTGENAKIILPSYLAFGELGSGNIIPPFTPLLYEININEIVN